MLPCPPQPWPEEFMFNDREEDHDLASDDSAGWVGVWISAVAR